MIRLIVILVSLVLIASFGVGWAGEKEELQLLQLRAELLITKANLAQCQANFAQCQQRESQKSLPEAQKAIQDFIKELDVKGYMVTQEGTIVEKPKLEPKSKEK